MENFIEVHEGGEKRLINLRWVEEVRQKSDGRAEIYFSFVNVGCNDQDWIVVDESYGEVLKMIWR